MKVIGAGVTGLAAGQTSRAPVYEQNDGPGGLCRSYYMRPGDPTRLDHAPPDGNAYRFEVGGGHWIFGGTPEVLELLDQTAPLKSYRRRAVVRLGDLGTTVGYPLQDHIDELPPSLSRQIARELRHNGSVAVRPSTLREWLQQSFGPTLCQLFFFPFHQRYTAGLFDVVAPQDGYKSPAFGVRAPARAGYNATFSYPEGGLDALAAAMSAQCDVRYGSKLVGIDPRCRILQFANGSEQGYGTLVSTVPLHLVMGLTRLELGDRADPSTSVLVLNIGAERGSECPDVHWQYEPDARSGFYRIGFYSSVDQSFLPKNRRGTGSHVSLYVERAYGSGDRPSEDERTGYMRAVVEELRGRGYIEAVEVVDPSWVEVAYTWRMPGSHWRDQALASLTLDGIHQVGRYGAWHFQGIADSVRDGLAIGQSVAHTRVGSCQPH
ncbi:MAG: FAD-dependent oxidoreductase [Actinomycetota bacterium]|nr:FAD-dependent oxidoreductase [Actinomycetota bacterium]